MLADGHLFCETVGALQQRQKSRKRKNSAAHRGAICVHQGRPQRQNTYGVIRLRLQDFSPYYKR